MINLTPHEIHLYRGDKIVETIPQSGLIARIKNVSRLVDMLGSWPVYQRSGTITKCLPKPRPDVIYIVSELVAKHNTHRDDLVFPETGELGIKNKHNQTIGTCAFRKADVIEAGRPIQTGNAVERVGKDTITGTRKSP